MEFDPNQYIKNNPHQADEVAKQWSGLVSANPELQGLETKEEFERYVANHPEKNIKPEEWNGRLIIDAYSDLRDQRERESEPLLQEGQHPFTGEGEGFLGGLVTLSTLYAQKPKIIEDDGNFKKLEEEKKKEWLEEHNQKDFTSKEGLDYLYGSLDNPGAPNLHDDTEKEFREKHNKKAEKYDKRISNIYKNPNNDPALIYIRRQVEEHKKARKGYYEKLQNPDVKFEDVEKQIEEKAWRKYVSGHLDVADENERKKREEKLKAYADKNENIAKSYKTITTEKEFKAYSEKEKKDVRYVDKIHPEGGSNKRIDEATGRLEAISAVKNSPPPQGTTLVSPQGKIISNIPQSSANTTGLTDINGQPLTSYRPPPAFHPYSKDEIGNMIEDSQPTHAPAGTYGGTQQNTNRQSSSNLLNRGVRKILGRGAKKEAEKQVEKQAEKKVAKKLMEKFGKQLLKKIAARAMTWLMGLLGTQLVVLLLLFGFTFFLVGFGGGGMGGGNQNTSGNVGVTPTPGSSGSFLDYSIPFRDSSINAINESQAKIEIKKRYPENKVDEYWDKIVLQSKANGWNSAFALTLWIEETGASRCTKASVGGGNVGCKKNADGSPAYSNGHLGCAYWQDQTIDESLSCLFNLSSSYPSNDRFEAFMRNYSGETSTSGPFTNNPNFPNNIKDVYSFLVPSGKGAIVSTRDSVSCPVLNAEIKNGSLNKSNNAGHCSSTYITACPENSRRAKSIDIDTQGDSIKLPTINSQKVNWFYATSFSLSSNDCEGEVADCGVGVVFKTKESPNWALHLLHLDQSSLSFDSSGPNESGKKIGKTAGNVYLHINIGKNIANPESVISGLKDFDKGWLKPEDLGMCTN